MNTLRKHITTCPDRPADTISVRSMFDSIASRYDLINSLLSLGMHRIWERRLVDALPEDSAGVCLDLCTGTGALAPRLSLRYRSVTGVDIAPKMLEVARRRWSSLVNVVWEEGDAQALPHKDDSFDCVTVAYGVRNWPHRAQGLREVARVLRPGGRVAILEFGQPKNALWRWLFNLYSRHVIPFVGGMISGNRFAYEYLPRTSAVFPCGESFQKELIEVGLCPRAARCLIGGVAYIYVAQKPLEEDRDT